MIANVLTWWTIFKISMEERLVYRADFAFSTLMRFLPIITQIFLWGAIFTATRSDEIAGYAYHDFIAYYMLTMISRALSSMPGLAAGIALQVREGEIKKFLIQPVDMIGYLFLMRVAHKLVYYLVALAPFALVFYLCRGYFSGWPDGPTLGAYFAALVMSFLLGFFLEAAIGMISFWWLEVSSLLFVYMLLNFFLSGHMFPLDILPEPWESIIRFLPLQYLAYFPTAVFLGKIEGGDLVVGLCIQFAWLLFFAVLSRVTFRLGVKRYSGFGG